MFIFLDIDGVMVPSKSWSLPPMLPYGFPALSSNATSVLKQLIGDDTTLMLTTTHKSNYNIDEWKTLFKERGIDIQKLDVLSDNVQMMSRKDEIVKGFNTHYINEDFIIIDDDKSLNDLPPI